MAHRPQWEVHHEIIPANPESIVTVTTAAGKDGWELTGILPVVVKTETPAPSPILLGEAENNRLAAAMVVQGQPQKQQGVLLLFKRLKVE